MRNKINPSITAENLFIIFALKYICIIQKRIFSWCYWTCEFLACLWLLRWLIRVALYSHWLQEYLTPSCLDFWCVLRCPLCVAWYSHWLQEYLTPSCLDSWCFLRSEFAIAWYSHWLQEYLTPSCLDSWCILRLCCCLIVTLVTGISDTFMFRFMESLKIPLLCRLILTLIARISNTFDITFCTMFTQTAFLTLV